MNKELISVIVPIYNASKSLRRCIDSIMEQSYSNFELILIDDGSKDNSFTICEEYLNMDNRIKLYRQKNSGASSARNYGLAKASGCYICFVDSDDYVDSNYLSDLYDNIKIYNSDLAVCGYCQEFYNGDILQTVKNFRFWDFDYVQKKDYYKLYVMIENGSINGPYCKLYKRSLIKKFKLKFNEDLVIQEDLDFLINYLKVTNKVSMVKKLTYHYIMLGTTSITSKFLPNRFNNYCYVFNNLLDFYLKLDTVCLNEINRIKYSYIKNLISSIINSFNDKNLTKNNRKKFIKNIIDSCDFEIVKAAKREGIKYFVLKKIVEFKNVSLLYFCCNIMYLIKTKLKINYK